MQTNKRAFTLVEVIVSLMVVGVLVLFAVSRQKDNLEEAKLTQIKSDIATMEKESRQKAILIENQTTNTKVDYSDIEDTKFYDKTGKLAVLPKGEYTNIDSKTLGVDTTLTGNFIKSENNEIYYAPKIEKVKEDIDANNKEIVTVDLKDNTPAELEKVINNTPKDKVAIYFTNEQNRMLKRLLTFYGVLYVPKGKTIAIAEPWRGLGINDDFRYTSIENMTTKTIYRRDQININNKKIIGKFTENAELRIHDQSINCQIFYATLYDEQTYIDLSVKIPESDVQLLKNPKLAIGYHNAENNEYYSITAVLTPIGDNTFEIKDISKGWGSTDYDSIFNNSIASGHGTKDYITGIPYGRKKKNHYNGEYHINVKLPDNIPQLHQGDTVYYTLYDDCGPVVKTTTQTINW
jgi:hypothetical protein